MVGARVVVGRVSLVVYRSRVPLVMQVASRMGLLQYLNLGVEVVRPL
jgi:hypothetical protein